MLQNARLCGWDTNRPVSSFKRRALHPHFSCFFSACCPFSSRDGHRCCTPIRQTPSRRPEQPGAEIHSHHSRKSPVPLSMYLQNTTTYLVSRPSLKKTDWQKLAGAPRPSATTEPKADISARRRKPHQRRRRAASLLLSATLGKPSAEAPSPPLRAWRTNRYSKCLFFGQIGPQTPQQQRREK